MNVNGTEHPRRVEDVAVVAAGVKAERSARLCTADQARPPAADDLVRDRLPVEEELDLVVVAHPQDRVDAQWVMGTVDRPHLRASSRRSRWPGGRDREAGGTWFRFVTRRTAAPRRRAADCAAAALAVAGASAHATATRERSSGSRRRMPSVIDRSPAALTRPLRDARRRGRLNAARRPGGRLAHIAVVAPGLPGAAGRSRAPAPAGEHGERLGAAVVRERERLGVGRRHGDDR